MHRWLQQMHMPLTNNIGVHNDLQVIIKNKFPYWENE